MQTLTPAQRRELKARAHHLHPVVIIGDAGLTPAVLREIDVNLKSHELIKIRVMGDDREQRAALVDTVCNALDAAPVQHIGKILVIWRKRDETDGDAATAAARKKSAGRRKPRRTKRSFQMA